MLLHGPWPRPQLKLCDFGFSKNEVVQSVSKSTCGTPEYMAPEVSSCSSPQLGCADYLCACQPADSAPGLSALQPADWKVVSLSVMVVL